MHLWAILTIISLSWLIRYQSVLTDANWYERWYKTLFLLLFPALLILNTAIAILYMGCHGAMLGVKVGSWGCALAGSLILFSCSCFIKLAIQSYRAILHIQDFPDQQLDNTVIKLIDLAIPYSAQIGFWQPKLVITQGLLNNLDQEHLQAVLAHEQAHLYYRDTFWFFWLGLIRSFTCWLPNTEILWQELLLLRELRADSKAAEKVDFLLLAESLLVVAESPLQSSGALAASFNDAQSGERLTERINFLLAEQEAPSTIQWYRWSWILILILPLLTIFLHY